MDEIEAKKLPILIVEGGRSVFEVVSAAIIELGYKLEHSERDVLHGETVQHFQHDGRKATYRYIWSAERVDPSTK